MNLNIQAVKVFVPAKDFKISLAFYQALGWTMNFNHEDSLAELQLGNNKFYLQDYYVKKWAHNFMMYIEVEDAEAWYRHVETCLNVTSYLGAKVNAPKEESHAKVTYVWDPSGVLLHFAESPKE